MKINELKTKLNQVFDNVEIETVHIGYAEDSITIDFSAQNDLHYINAQLTSRADPFQKSGDNINLADNTITTNANLNRIYEIRIDCGIIDDYEHVNDDDTVELHAESLDKLIDLIKIGATHANWPVKNKLQSITTDELLKDLVEEFDNNIDNIDNVKVDNLLYQYFVNSHRLSETQWLTSNVHQLNSLFNDINDATDGEGAELEFLNSFLLEVVNLIAKTNAKEH